MTVTVLQAVVRRVLLSLGITGTKSELKNPKLEDVI
jgi:hypothetical protein